MSTPDEISALQAVAAETGPVVTLRAVADRVKKPVLDVAKLMGKLQTEGLIAFYLTSGYALTPRGKEALAPKKQVAEGGTFTKSAGSKMPVSIHPPHVQIQDAAAVAKKKKIAKMKEFADQRARTRARLRTLAQESGLPRRESRSLRS